MQKTTNTEDQERDFDRTSDPLAGSGFEQEQTDPEFADENDNEEAEAK